MKKPKQNQSNDSKNKILSESNQKPDIKRNSEEIIEYLTGDYYGGNPDKPRITNLEHLLTKTEKW